MPVYTIVIQNAVPQSLLGTVTGLSQFFRSIGGTLGLACLGSLLLSFYHSRLLQTIDRALPPSVISALENPLQPNALKTALEKEELKARQPYLEATMKTVNKALFDAIRLIYVLYGSALAGTVLLNLLLEELPLRSEKTEIFLEKP